MKTFFRKKTWLILSGIIISAILFLGDFNHNIKIAQATTDDNVYGWAWNDAVGWISFNCENTDYCATSSYGINIEDNGLQFSGYAWSEVEGWIKFNPEGPYPGNPSSSTTLDIDTREISGWARICGRADDPVNCTGGNGKGWIKMRCEGAECATVDYGVYLDNGNRFHGFGYSYDIGWISFNSRNCDANGDGFSDGAANCPAAGTPIGNYKVGMVTNISGWAYSENIGWISFNCHNTEGAGAEDCGAGFYGVNLELADYIFAGYAWSPNVGWVSFQENDPPNFDFSADCSNPATCDDAGDNCTACYNFSDSKVYGWAKILSMGDDGWIRLDDDDILDVFNYGVALGGSNEFNGWAWNGGDGTCSISGAACSDLVPCGGGEGVCEPEIGAGWISFNCSDKNSCNGTGDNGEACDNDADCPSGEAGSCIDTCVNFSDYKVIGVDIHIPPRAENLTAPNWSFSDACYDGEGQARGAKLKWNFVDPNPGSYQSAYQVIVDTVNNPAAPNVYDSGKVIDGALHIDLDETELNNYDTSYYWWVIVWDDYDLPSDVMQFNTMVSGHQLLPIGQAEDDGVSNTFTTYKHEFPYPDFIHYIPSPSAEEQVKFISTTSAKYYTFPGNVKHDCDGNCGWAWTTNHPFDDDINNNTASTTIIEFKHKGDSRVYLEIEDNDGYFCSTTTDFIVRERLPTWIETK